MSSSQADPLSVFTTLANQQLTQQHQFPNKAPRWFCQGILHYYVLLHDVVDCEQARYILSHFWLLLINLFAVLVLLLSDSVKYLRYAIYQSKYRNIKHVFTLCTLLIHIVSCLFMQHMYFWDPCIQIHRNEFSQWNTSICTITMLKYRSTKCHVFYSVTIRMYYYKAKIQEHNYKNVLSQSQNTGALNVMSFTA